MGLGIIVGMLADLIVHDPEGADWEKESLRRINEVLEEQGLPLHHEPVKLPRLPYRALLRGFPYSWIHYLRRFAAHLFYDKGWSPIPVEEGDDPADDDFVDEALSVYMDSHLICHSDAEGYYLPMDFHEPIYDFDDDRILGGILGASYRLKEELERIAGPLEIPLVPNADYPLDNATVDVLNQTPEDHPFMRERKVWFTLFDAAWLSIEYGTAIRFS